MGADVVARAHRHTGGWRHALNDSTSNAVLGGGGTVGIDFKNLGMIPIGLLGSVKTEASGSAGADLANRSTSYGLGLFFTGWDDFSIWLETSMRQLTLKETKSASTSKESAATQTVQVDRKPLFKVQTPIGVLGALGVGLVVGRSIP